MASRMITKLVPEMQPKVQNLLIRVWRELRIRLMVTCTLRSTEEQDKLYAQGRAKPGPIVTKARGGESWHNFGRAVDVVPCKGESGEPDWGASEATWQAIGRIGESEGLEWGGAWSGKFQDRPHFQFTQGRTLTEERLEHGIVIRD